MCEAFTESYNANWFYRILLESGLFPIFINLAPDLESIPDEIIRALIESQGNVDANALEKVLLVLFTQDNFTFYCNARGELTVEVLPIGLTQNLVFQDGQGGTDNAIFQDNSNWIVSEPSPTTLPSYEFWLRRFFSAFGVKVHVVPLPYTFASQFLYKGTFDFDYNVSEVAKDINNNIYICDTAGNVYKSPTLGAYWVKIIDNTYSSTLKKVEILSYEKDDSIIERIIVFGGAELTTYNIEDYTIVTVKSGVYFNKLSGFMNDVYFNQLSGFVKMHDDTLYYLGGVNSSLTLTDDLYKVQLNDDDSVDIELLIENATGVGRKSPTLTKISNSKFCLTYSYDISDSALFDVFIFDVFDVTVDPNPIVLNHYKYPAVFYRKGYVYIVGGLDIASDTPNRNAERIDPLFTAVNNVTIDIGFDMLKCATIEFSELDTARILTSDKIVYGI